MANPNRGSRLSQQALYLLLFKDAQYILAVGRIVDIGTGEQFIDYILHLHVAEHLALGYGGMTGHAEGQFVVNVVLDSPTLLTGRGKHVVQQGTHIDALDAGRRGVNGIAASAKVCKFETHIYQLGHNVLQYSRIGYRQLDHLGKHHLLRLAFLALYLLQIAFI